MVVASAVVSLVQDKLLHWQLTDKQIDMTSVFRSFTTDDRIYPKNLSSTMVEVFAVVFSYNPVSTFVIMSVHNYCTGRYTHTAYIHLHKDTHSLIQVYIRHY